MDGKFTPIHGIYRDREDPFQTPPSLRTVQAVLSHTTLKLIVFSLGSARLRNALFEGVAQKAKSVRVIGFVNYPGLVRIQFELMAYQPLSHCRKSFQLSLSAITNVLL
jgi:hypothetical protein